MTTLKRTREHRAYPRLTAEPRERHGYDIDKSHEQIRRPFGAVPRNGKGWQ